MENNENLKDWVKDYTINQVAQIQGNVNIKQNSLEKFFKDATNELYDKLSPKLDEINNKVDRNQNTIDSMQSTQQHHQQLLHQHTEIINSILNSPQSNQTQTYPNINNGTAASWLELDRVNSRIDTIEARIPDFDNLPEQIATEIARALVVNDDIIRGGGDYEYISDNDRKNEDKQIGCIELYDIAELNCL